MLKILLKLIKIILVLILILILFLSFLQVAPRNYTKTVTTGANIEKKYLACGKHNVSYVAKKAGKPYKKFEIWYPTDLKDSDKEYPVVIVMNGSGNPASKYKAVFQHLASWGFVAIGNEDPNTGKGESADILLEYLILENENKDSVFYQRIDINNIGIEGHSQGGAGVFSALSITKYRNMYKAAVALSPANEEGAHKLGWKYDLTKVEAPCLILAGTEGEFETEIVLPIEAMNRMYDKIKAPKAMMRRIKAEHGQMLYMADGYATAWLMWKLKGDKQAAKAFMGDKPEIMMNSLYQDQRIDVQ